MVAAKDVRNLYILGVGRSGTTALYVLLQKIFSDLYGEDGFRCRYEPFVWGKPVWDIAYERAIHHQLFHECDSLSIPGLYCHTRMPLFVEASQTEDTEALSLFTRLLDPGGKPLVVKFIRANGRLTLLNRVDPDARILFVLRNPVSVLNSLMGKFSFYGGEYHPSDWPRFTDEVARVFGVDLTSEDIGSEVEQEAQHWLYMNRFFVDRLDSHGKNILPLAYENFQTDKRGTVRRICEFLGVESREVYLDAVSEPVGATTRNVVLTEKNIRYLSPFMDEYTAMCEKAGISINTGYMDCTIREIKQNASSVEYKTILKGKTPNTIRRACLEQMAESPAESPGPGEHED